MLNVAFNTLVLRDVHRELASDDLVELLENGILGHGSILFILELDHFEHPHEVLLKSDLVADQFLITMGVELPILVGHVHIIGLVVAQVVHGGLQEAHHLLGK